MKHPQPAISEQHEIELTDLTYSPDAIGRINEVVTFVKRGAPGETARVEITAVKKRHQHAKIIEILSSSPHRCPPPCPYFLAGCGGCQWQHISYETQLASKARVLTETLKRIGKLTDLPTPTLHPAPQPLAYRNNIRLAITSIQPRIEFGFKQEGSHNIVPIDRCEIACPSINRALPQLAAFIADHRLLLVDELTVRTSVTTGDVMVILIFPNGYKSRLELTDEALQNYPAIQSVYLKSGQRGETIWVGGKKTLSESVGGWAYEIGADTFFQNNLDGLKALIDIVAQHLKTIKPLMSIDAHCGVGTFTLPMARASQFAFGVELRPKSIALAKENAQNNGISNADFRVGHLAKINNIRADCILLNPPRGGCWPKDLDAVRRISPKHILYISCNPATLARDLSKLKETYQLCALDLVDLFPMTYHFETVVWLRRW
jgi:23S rRNA (uracil1939-C5)-methyltransferase